MVRCVLLGATLAITQLFYAQNQKLFYVKENDSMTTVRDENNKIVIPAYVDGDFRTEDKEEVTDDIVFTYERFLKTKVYNRKGEFLFEPALFDYSALFKEGYIPFKENGKYGLANREGKKVIAATYDYMAHPEDGVVFACNNCRFDRKVDPEHPPLVEGTWLWLDTKGKVLDSKLYAQLTLFPSPLPQIERLYNSDETTILSHFDALKSRIKSKLKIQDEAIKFEVVYKPTLFKPYYHVKLYKEMGGKFMTDFDDQEFENFYVSKDLKTYLVLFEEWQELNVGKEKYIDVKKKYADVYEFLE